MRAGTAFEWVVPHVYRKTVATMLDQGGLSAGSIADQLGHSRISMTQDVYMARRADDGSVASALEELLAEDGLGNDDAAPAGLGRAVVRPLRPHFDHIGARLDETQPSEGP